MSKCIDCDEARALYEDPRVPPLEEGVCLCLSCWDSAADERIEDLQDEIDELQQDRASFMHASRAATPGYRRGQPMRPRP